MGKGERMLLDEIKKVDLQSFKEKYPFEQTIHASKDELKAAIESGSLHYVWLPACPRANRTTSVFKWYDLDQLVAEHRLSPYYKLGENWVFQEEDDPFKETSIQEYFPEGKRATQPFLYDQAKKRVVTNNTYYMSLLMAEWMDEADEGELSKSLFPKAHREMLEKWNAWLYEKVNLKIYQVASKTGEAKEEGIEALDSSYQLLDDYLSANTYLYANQLTETDFRLFHNLIRHQLYYRQFKVFKRPLKDFVHLERYVQRLLAEHPAVGDDLYFEEIRETHFRSDHNIKKYGYREDMPLLEELFPFLKIED